LNWSDPYVISAGLGIALLIWSLYWLWGCTRPKDSIPFADFKTQTLRAGDLDIHYHQSGRGPHILLLHGIGANLFCWRWLVPVLNQKFTVTAIDLPGFGRSSKPATAGYGLDEQTQRLVQILDGFKISKTYIVGNSMGANLALWLALKCPERVQGLALIAPATSARLIPPLEKVAWLAGPASLLLNRYAMKWAHGRTVSRQDRVDNNRVEETYFTYVRNTEAVRSFMLAAKAIRDPRLTSSLKAFERRVLILWGSNDRLVNRKVIDQLSAALPKAQTIIHVGGGHHLQEDEPEWVAEQLSDFFQV
jgi:abhydrolase domain-containing protein 6